MWIIKDDNLINLDSIKKISIEKSDGTVNSFQLVGYFIYSGYVELSDSAEYETIEQILKDIRRKIIHKEPYLEIISIEEAKRRMEIKKDIRTF